MKDNLNVAMLIQNVYQVQKCAMKFKIAQMEVMRIKAYVVSENFPHLYSIIYTCHSPFTLDCCNLLVVKYTHIGYTLNSEFYRNYPNLFTTYEKQSNIINGRSFYKSLQGNFSLEYAQCAGKDAWAFNSPTSW